METNETPGKETITQWDDDPINLKWRIFNFNREGKHILPTKRLKATGRTVNFTYALS